MSHRESSKIIDSIIATTTRLSSTIAHSSEHSIDFLKQQQMLIKQHLENQQLLNNNLYESLLNTGLMKHDAAAASSNGVNHLNSLGSSLATSTAKMTNNILDLLRQNRAVSNSFSNLGFGSSSTPSNSLMGGNLTSMLPLGDLFTNLSGVFERLFGTKFWIYALIAILSGLIFTFIACFCMYCCCCTRLGRTLMCCCRCGSFSFGSSSKSSAKKKKKKLMANESTGKCCI